MYYCNVLNECDCLSADPVELGDALASRHPEFVELSNLKIELLASDSK